MFDMTVLAVGCLLMLASFTVLPWFRADPNGPYAPPDGGPAPRTFGDLRAHFSSPHSGRAGNVYFDWLAWTLFAVLLLIGVAGMATSRRVPGGRWLPVAIGVLGVWATYVAFDDMRNTGDPSWVHRADVGVWLSMVGLLLAGVGASLTQRHAVAASRAAYKVK